MDQLGVAGISVVPVYGRMFTISGKTHELRFSQNALYLLERELKRPLREALVAISISELQAMLWAGLEGARLKRGERLEPYTLYEAGDIIDELGGMGRAVPLVMEAWKAAMPTREEDAPGSPDPFLRIAAESAPEAKAADCPARRMQDLMTC